MKKIIPLLSIILSAASFTFSQDIDKAIKEIDSKLGNDQTSISAVLSDPAYMYLHSKTSFREVIKKHAKPGKVTMVVKDEPGKKILVRSVITTEDGKPLDNAVVYLYHTSAKGWYSDTAPHITTGKGDYGHARLFCYLMTDSKGQFEIETIQAIGYPNSDFPAHIHIEAWKNGNHVDGVPGELLFDDDPRLNAERKSRAIRDGFLVEKNTGTAANPVYLYNIKLKQ